MVSRYGEAGDVVDIGAPLMEIEEQAELVGSEPQKSEQKDAATVVGNVSNTAHKVDVDDFWIGSTHNPSTEDLITALPSARILANKLGVELKSVKGTGHNGMITDNDVYAEAGKQSLRH